MRITIVGHVCIDVNHSEHASYVAAGSPAMFMHRVFALLPGCLATILAPYGTDFLPYKNRVRFYPRKPNVPSTLMYENTTRDGKRLQRAFHRETALPVRLGRRHPVVSEATDILIVAPLLPNFTARYVSGLTRRSRCLTMLLPQGYFRKFLPDNSVAVREFREAPGIVRFFDIVVVSEQDHPRMSFLAKTWAGNGRTVAIVTRGGKGAVAFQGKKAIRLPTEPVPENRIVDSVGAGDVFAAGFAYRYRQTGDIAESGRFANALAGQSLYFPTDNISFNLDGLI